MRGIRDTGGWTGRDNLDIILKRERLVNVPRSWADDAVIARARRWLARGRMNGWSVLIVDDDRALGDLLGDALSLSSIATFAAHDGEEGLRLARELLPSAILLDLRLPRLDGYEVARRLKADPSTRQIPLIALTTATMPADKARARDAGCDDFVAKPFDLDDLEAALLRHLPRPDAHCESLAASA
jgi:two-component system, cell cycle response regulator DivK